MCLLDVKHDLQSSCQTNQATYIQFANILKVLVQRFYHVVNELEQGQLVDVVVDVDSNDEVQRGVPTVNYFVLPMFQEGTLVLCAGETFPYKLTF